MAVFDNTLGSSLLAWLEESKHELLNDHKLILRKTFGPSGYDHPNLTVNGKRAFLSPEEKAAIGFVSDGYAYDSVARTFNGKRLSDYTASQRRHIYYFLAGYDARSNTLYGVPIATLVAINQKEQSILANYVSHIITLLATFFGLPTYLANLDKKQTWKNIGKQFIGWQHKRNRFQRRRSTGLNVLAMLIFVPFNLLTLLPKLALNIIKLFTEILPYYLYLGSALLTIWAAKTCITQTNTLLNSNNTPENRLFSLLLALVAAALALAAGVIAVISALTYYVGRAMTAPIDSVREDWAYWEDYNPRRLRLLSFTIRFVMTGLRVVTTIAAYTLIGLFLGPLLGPIIIPFSAAHAPLWVIAALRLVCTIAMGFAQLSGGLLPTLAFAGLIVGMTASTCFTAIGSVLKSPINWFTTWLHTKPAPRQAAPADKPVHKEAHSHHAERSGERDSRVVTSGSRVSHKERESNSAANLSTEGTFAVRGAAEVVREEGETLHNRVVLG